jgi:hypothetical protein
MKRGVGLESPDFLVMAPRVRVGAASKGAGSRAEITAAAGSV